MALKDEWAGELGKSWSEIADAIDGLFDPTGAVGIRHLGDIQGSRVLDIGCGAGATTRAMADLGAEVVGADISVDLLAEARRRDPEGLCTFVAGDAADLRGVGQFDALYSRCGAMFFDRPVEAWSRLRAMTASGGKVVVVCWTACERNAWAYEPLRAAASVLGNDRVRMVPSGTPGPFAWAEPEFFVPIFEGAGWSDLSFETVRKPALMEAGAAVDPLDRAVAFARRVGPLRANLEGVSAEQTRKILDALRVTLRDRLCDGRVWTDSETWIIEATA